MSLTASISPWEPKIEIIDQSHFNVRAVPFKASGSGKMNDWSAIQGALFAARDQVRETLAPGDAPAIHRTGTSWSPTVYLPPGEYVIDRPLIKYPHVSIEGGGWGRTALKLHSGGWTPSAQPMATNPQGIMWVGPTGKASALLWLQGDEEWPERSGLRVAGMVDSIRHLGFKCADGAGIFINGNQNHTSIQNCWINGWGNGPTGLGIVCNNPTSSTQITNLFCDHNMIEGCRVAMVLDRVVIGSIDHNQIESCGNGIYVGSADSLDINDNKLTCTIPQKPFENGIWIGCGISCSISGNTFRDVTKKAIKHLGRNSTIANNRIYIKNGRAINESGYAIHIVGPAKQFGGDTSVLGQHGVHHIHGNNIDADLWPKAQAMPGFPNPVALKSIWIDEAPGEKIKAVLANNVDGLIV